MNRLRIVPFLTSILLLGAVEANVQREERSAEATQFVALGTLKDLPEGLVDRSGRVVSLDALRGKELIGIYFCASW